MEDSRFVSAEECGEGGLTLLCPPASSPVPDTMNLRISSASTKEGQAVSMANNDNSQALPSPAEASPAKLATVSPSITNRTIETSPTTSDITSASDSLTSAERDLPDTTMPCSVPPLLSTYTLSPTPNELVPVTPFDKDPPNVLTFKGISVTLENNSVWKQFHQYGTEMILTKQGRRMFPYCRYRLAGLEPARRYSLVLSILPADQYRYRWNRNKWEASGPAEHQSQGLTRAFAHHHSSCTGLEWMRNAVSFYKLKLTNNPLDDVGHVILHSMHRYIPRLHVIPVLDGEGPTVDQPVIQGPESLMFTFPQTTFFAVTSYQNMRITRLKINHNPFARGFRDDGHNPRLCRPKSDALPAGRDTTQNTDMPSGSHSDDSKDFVDPSMMHFISAAPSDKETESGSKQKNTAAESQVLTDVYAGKEIMNVDGDHHLSTQMALPLEKVVLDTPISPKSMELVKCENHLSPIQKVEPALVCKTIGRLHKMPAEMTPKPSAATPKSNPASLSGFAAVRKRRKRLNRHWGNSRGKEWKPGAASTPASSLSVTVAMQPELDDVEGLLFVSFTSKEALGVHVDDMPANSSSPVSPTSPPQSEKTVEEAPETDEEKIARLQAVLLQDLSVIKHRQVIHPVLQEVGLKLGSLDPTQIIDLKYLGVQLPLPPLVRSEQDNTTSVTSTAGGLGFVSRTGKTSDLTKIKGWRDKFTKNKESPPASNTRPLKNLSAFCSNMLDEYLKSEAQQISERADAFSTSPDSSVAYQLPVKGSSYVKTLDSALKHRNTTPKPPAWNNRPCPLSHKPLLYSVLTTPPPPLASHSSSPPKTKGRPKQQTASPPTPQKSMSNAPKPGHVTNTVKSPVLKAKGGSGDEVAHRPSPALQRSTSANAAISAKLGQGVSTNRQTGLSKIHQKLAEMEEVALNDGFYRTELSPQRLSVALSVILTAQTQPSQRLSIPESGGSRDSDCGKDFCRLGCVCSSLHRSIRGPLHCRRPDCMLGCTCFKRKIVKQATAADIQEQEESQDHHVYSVSYMQHEVQPSPGSHSGILWDKSSMAADPEPLFIPKPSKLVRQYQHHALHPNQSVQEGQKDPIYRYFESMMTCARVRGTNRSKIIEPALSRSPPAVSSRKVLQKTASNTQKNTHTAILRIEEGGKALPQDQSSEMDFTTMMEIQSNCSWDKDRKMVVADLCRRLKQNGLSQPFNIGPYYVRLVTKVYTRKPNRFTVTYKVSISKPKKTSDEDDGKSDASGDEEADNSSDEKEDSSLEESEMPVGVVPFLRRVLPAGRLRARTKPRGRPAVGLIQVNGKSYTQARLLLGGMGSLHPANRLAAFVTGRLRGGAKTQPNGSKKAAGPLAPTSNKAGVKKTANGQPGETVKPNPVGKGQHTTLPHSTSPSTSSPLITFITGRHGCVTSCQSASSSLSSSLSLTVSPTMKTPIFLGKSGTYSFRLCPPPADQGSKGSDQNPTGKTPRGGFTLIQIPKQEDAGADIQSARPVCSADKKGKSSSPSLHATTSECKEQTAVDSGHANTVPMDLSNASLSKTSSSPDLICDERMQSDGSDDVGKFMEMRQTESDLDVPSDDSLSDCSDSDEPDDKEFLEEMVDIETVEEERQRHVIDEMRATAKCLLTTNHRESSEDSGSAREQKASDASDDNLGGGKRRNHKVTERLRRTEQRHLFNRLQTILHSDPKAPKLRLLSQALDEIRNLVGTCSALEEKKKRLEEEQDVHVKKISRLSGRSEEAIMTKLREIFERQSATAPEGYLYFPPPLRKRSQSLKSKVSSQWLTNQPQPEASTLSAAAQDTELQPQPKLQEGTVSARAQDIVPQVPQSLPPKPGRPPPRMTVKAMLAKSDPAPPTPCESPPSMTLPLVRSKTGRIILPSSMRPAGPGFYTLKVMAAEKKGSKRQEGEREDSTAPHMQLTDQDTSGHQERRSPEPEQPSESLKEEGNPECDGTVKEEKTSPSDNGIRPSDLKSPLVKIASLNNSIWERSVAVHTVKESKKLNGSTVLVLSRMKTTACLTFNPATCPVPVQSKQQETAADPASVAGDNHAAMSADDGTPVIRRRRGRPRKNRLIPITPKVTVTLRDYAKLVPAGTNPNDWSPATDGQAPVKRCRGRPRKIRPKDSKCPEDGTSPVVRSTESTSAEVARVSKSPLIQMRRSHATSSDSESSPPKRVKYRGKKTRGTPTADVQLGDIKTTRPVTRGALGKDFPSAKKRSWIDIEKDLIDSD